MHRRAHNDIDCLHFISAHDQLDVSAFITVLVYFKSENGLAQSEFVY